MRAIVLGKPQQTLSKSIHYTSKCHIWLQTVQKTNSFYYKVLAIQNNSSMLDQLHTTL